MTDSSMQDHILNTLRDLGAQLTAHSRDSAARIDTLREQVNSGIAALREANDRDHSELHQRIDTQAFRLAEVETDQVKQTATMSGAWKVLVAIASAIGVAGGWLASYINRN